MALKKELKLTKKYAPLSNRRYREIPQLSLSGVWLEEAGFGIGYKVDVSVEKGKIILEPKPKH